MPGAVKVEALLFAFVPVFNVAHALQLRAVLWQQQDVVDAQEGLHQGCSQVTLFVTLGGYKFRCLEKSETARSGQSGHQGGAQG